MGATGKGLEIFCREKAMKTTVLKDRRSGADRRSGKDRRRFNDPRYFRSGDGQGSQTQDMLERAMKLKQQFAEIWHKKGREFLRLKKYDEAKIALNQATSIKPGLAQAWYDLAGIYATEGFKANALSHLEKAIELDKKYRNEAKFDKNFQPLQDDPDFQTLTG